MGTEKVPKFLLLRVGKSAYPLPGECPDLSLFRRARPHLNRQFIARYLELAYEISAHIGGGKRTFEVMRNSVLGFVYGVGAKICFVSVEQLGAVTLSGDRSAAINGGGTVRSQQLHSYVPACVVYQIAFGYGSEALLNGSAVLQPNNSGDEPPCTYQLPSATGDSALQNCVSIPLLSGPGNCSGYSKQRHKYSKNCTVPHFSLRMSSFRFQSRDPIRLPTRPV
jgi:hypothetical protein